jgi:hypothetical protein
MKRKNLSKKIRRLEARLQKGAAKLAKLKQKLAAVATADANTQNTSTEQGFAPGQGSQPQ